MKLKPTILILDDDDICREMMVESLSEDNCTILEANTIWQAHTLAEKNVLDVLITDYKLNEGDSIPFIDHLNKKSPNTSVLVVTAYPEMQIVNSLSEYNVCSMLVKPFDTEQLRFAVFQELAKRKTVEGQHILETLNEAITFGLIGHSQYINKLRKSILQLGKGNFPVLIQGDSGTGKEVVAHGLHSSSKQQERPMITVNCAAIPQQLEESEFFGHVKGSFTGAHTSKEGYIAAAHGSTLFLDEIGELSLEVQAKLLRVLDSGEYTRIGEAISRHVDIRILSATNRNLEDMVSRNLFRKDLFFRLKGAIIITEPLAEHPEDITDIATIFLKQFAIDQKPKIFTNDAIAILRQYKWPGNVRELHHITEYLSTIVTGQRIDSAIVRDTLKIDSKENSIVPPYYEARNSFEKKYFEQILELSNGNTAKAARIVGLQRPSLIRKLARLEIEPKKFRNS